MKATVFGAILGAGLVVAALGLHPERGRAYADPYTSDRGDDLITLAASAGEDRQQLTVVDPKTRVLSVYHINLANGEVTLKSVRNINWDLQMVEFNGVSPLPREIRSLLEQN